MHFATSGINRLLKVSSMFGVASGVLLLSSVAYSAPILGRAPVVHSAPFTFSSLELPSVIDGLFVIFGGLVALFARMSVENRGALVFFVFLASVLAIIGSWVLLGSVFLGS